MFTSPKSGIWIAALVCGTLLADDAYGFLYRTPKGTLKDNHVVWHDGKYYLFAMYSDKMGDIGGSEGQWCNAWSAVSTDGVHWQDVGPVIENAPFIVHGLRVSKTVPPDRFPTPLFISGIETSTGRRPSS